MVFLQINSDLHLEFYKTIAAVPYIEPKAPILVLAGDVGYPTQSLFWDFLKRCSQDFQHVLVVLGNHEYYNSTTQVSKGKALSMERVEELVLGMLEYQGLTNVHLLQKSEIILEGVRFVGATLWSAVHDDQALLVQFSMNDYRNILVTDTEKLSVLDTNILHKDHSAFLRESLAKSATIPEPTVVITHHLPTPALIHEKYAGSELNAAFASDILETLEDSHVPAAWICGHSHSSNRMRIRGCECVLNPWGYPNENRIHTDVLLEIPTSVS
jgi:Icc-related predicted phosphoesterase